MIGKSLSLLIACLGLLPLTTLAQDPVTIRMDASAEHISLEDELVLTITVEGAQQVGSPELPSLPAFRVVESSQSSSLQIINGAMSFKKLFSYVLIPQEVGKFTIPPAQVHGGGQTVSSNELTILVESTPGGGQYQFIGPHHIDPPQAKAPLPTTPGSGSTPKDIPEENRPPLWVSAEVSNKNPYLNEQILYTFRFYNSVTILEATYHQPEFEDIWMEEVVPEKKVQQTIDGRQYVVFEKVLALTPLRSGDYVIPSMSLQVSVADKAVLNHFDNFFGLRQSPTKTKQLKTESIKIAVKPLPEPRPADFSQLVGQFELEASLQPQSIKLGDTATLKIILRGRGNIRDGVIPALDPNLPVKVYEDKPELQTRLRPEGVSGEKIFKRAIVPLQPGVMDLPALSVSYFDPQKNDYVKLIAQAHSIEVIGEKQPEPSSAMPPKKIASDQSTPGLRTQMKLAQDQPWQFHRGLFVILIILPPCIYLVLLLIIQQARRARAMNARTRAKKAVRIFKKKIVGLPTDPQQSAMALKTAIREFIGDRYELTTTSLTMAEIEAELMTRSLPKPLIKTLLQHLSQLEAAEFGGIKLETSLEIVAEVTKIIRELDQVSPFEK